MGELGEFPLQIGILPGESRFMDRLQERSGRVCPGPGGGRDFL
jgi:hypothetical protein